MPTTAGQGSERNAARWQSRVTFVLGASHHGTDPIALGAFVRASGRLRADLEDGRRHLCELCLDEVAFLLTCNRAEIYAVASPLTWTAAADALLQFVFAEGSSKQPHSSYCLQGADALRHLCRVSCGLDSRLVGEKEISRQVALAMARATGAEHACGLLRMMGSVARTATRRALARSSLGSSRASIFDLVTAAAANRLGALHGCSAVVVGAGDAARGVCYALRSHGVTKLVIANRSLENAERLAAEMSARAASLRGLPSLLGETDLVLSAASCEAPILGHSVVRDALSRRGTASTLLIIDIGVPANVDPRVAALAQVDLVRADELRVDRETTMHPQDVAVVEQVIDQLVADFVSRWGKAGVEEFIAKMRRRVEDARAQAVRKWLQRRISEAPPSEAELDGLTRSVVDKALHLSMTELRSTSTRVTRHAACR